MMPKLFDCERNPVACRSVMVLFLKENGNHLQQAEENIRNSTILLMEEILRQLGCIKPCK